MSAEKSKKEDGGATKKGTDEKKYVQFAPETVSIIAESLGIANLNSNISRALSEDVSYRCRELANVKFVRKENRNFQ